MNEDLSQMIGKIMSNPEFGKLVNQLKNSETPSEGAEEKGSETQQNTERKDNTAMPSAESIAEKLPDLMGMLSQSGVSSSSVDNKKIEKALGALRKMDNRNCEKLLSALKPYLNSQRGEVIDKAVSMMKVTDILGAIQQTDQKGNK